MYFVPSKKGGRNPSSRPKKAPTERVKVHVVIGPNVQPLT